MDPFLGTNMAIGCDIHADITVTPQLEVTALPGTAGYSALRGTWRQTHTGAVCIQRGCETGNSGVPYNPQMVKYSQLSRYTIPQHSFVPCSLHSSKYHDLFADASAVPGPSRPVRKQHSIPIIVAPTADNWLRVYARRMPAVFRGADMGPCTQLWGPGYLTERYISLSLSLSPSHPSPPPPSLGVCVYVRVCVSKATPSKRKRRPL